MGMGKETRTHQYAPHQLKVGVISDFCFILKPSVLIMLLPSQTEHIFLKNPTISLHQIYCLKSMHFSTLFS